MTLWGSPQHDGYVYCLVQASAFPGPATMANNPNAASNVRLISHLVVPSGCPDCRFLAPMRSFSTCSDVAPRLPRSMVRAPVGRYRVPCGISPGSEALFVMILTGDNPERREEGSGEGTCAHLADSTRTWSQLRCRGRSSTHRRAEAGLSSAHLGGVRPCLTAYLVRAAMLCRSSFSMIRSR